METRIITGVGAYKTAKGLVVLIADINNLYDNRQLAFGGFHTVKRGDIFNLDGESALNPKNDRIVGKLTDFISLDTLYAPGNWFAMDSDGKWHIFWNLPVLEEGKWEDYIREKQEVSNPNFWFNWDGNYRVSLTPAPTEGLIDWMEENDRVNKIPWK